MTLAFRGYKEFMAETFDDGEELCFHVCRGEVALVQSVTNHGKSTAIRISGLCLASGREFSPFVPASRPLKVVLLNFEGSGRRFQGDIEVMAEAFSDVEIALIEKNFIPVHAPTIGDEALSLSRHMAQLEPALKKLKPDVLIIDTASAAFDVSSEGDNAEIGRLMKRLVALARKLNCAVIVLHHIGKAKAEDGVVREPAHRGRGASAWADFATAIFNLEASAKDRSEITVTCAKRKSGDNYEVVMKLDCETRWLTATGEAPAKSLTSEDKVLATLAAWPDGIATGDLVLALASVMKERTVKDALSRLAKRRLASQPKYGYWQAEPPPAPSVQSVQPHIRVLHDCTLNNNGHKSLPKSAENADSYVNLHTAHLPEVLLIPASVPNDEESIAHCIAAQRIAEVA